MSSDGCGAGDSGQQCHSRPVTERLTSNMDLFNLSAVKNLTMDTLNFTFETMPTFTSIALMKTIVLSLIGLLSFMGNIITLISIRRNMSRRRSTVYILISHLAFADVLVSLFCAVTEAVWTYTVQWLAGNTMCKMIKFSQMFSLYLTTFIVVLISVDRFIAMQYPLKRANAPRNCHLMIVSAWVLSLFLSIPQVIVFHVVRGPFKEEFYQCVTYGSYSAEWQQQLYIIVTLVFMFILPLVIMVTAYVSTLRSISKSKRLFQEGPRTYVGAIRQKLLTRAKMKSLILTVIITGAFIICWIPYNVMMLVNIFLEPDEHLSAGMQSAIFFFGMSNSVVNPLIYGVFHVHKSKKSGSGPVRHISQSTVNTDSSARRSNATTTTTTGGGESSTTMIIEVFETGCLMHKIRKRGLIIKHLSSSNMYL